MPIFVKQTIVEYIDYCSEKYDNFYDYSLIEKEYTEEEFNSHVKINIICPIHGVFRQEAASHKKKYGCSKCGRQRTAEYNKKDKEWFIKRAIKVHGNSFTYIGEYINSYTKIDIKCNTCQTVFSQLPSSHLQGTGCKKCKIKINAENFSKKYKGNYKRHPKYTNESFISACITKYGDKYDLSKVDMKGWNSKILVGCKIHGFFLVVAGDFLTGTGCYNCGREKINKSKIKDTKHFIKKARKTHGNKYNYTNSMYTGLYNKLQIECPEHGTFFQRPCDHYKSECPLCGLERTWGSLRLSNSIFLERLIDIYGDKYDYSKINYTHHDGYSILGCEDHGDLEVSNRSLLMGGGCPRCTGSSSEKLIDTYLSELNIKFIREYRVSEYRYRWDFYLPEYRIFIEYHGQQHYKAIDHFGGENDLENTKVRDKHKEYIVKQELGCKLIVLNYLDKENNNLKKILINKLVDSGVNLKINEENT